MCSVSYHGDHNEAVLGVLFTLLLKVTGQHLSKARFKSDAGVKRRQKFINSAGSLSCSCTGLDSIRNVPQSYQRQGTLL